MRVEKMLAIILAFVVCISMAGVDIANVNAEEAGSDKTALQVEVETKDDEVVPPIAVRCCNCGFKMYIYTYGLSDEEKAVWGDHMMVHLQNGESTSYHDRKYKEVCKIFTDVKHDSWYEAAVQYVYDKGLMEGNGDKFTPNGRMTRGMFVTTLYRLAGEPEITDRSACTELRDVAENAWYTDAVCWAYANGITTGYENDRTFRTNVALSREQLATFVYRYADYQELDVSASDDLEGLLNADKVKPYAEKEVKWAVGAGIINGMEGKDEAGNPVYDLAPQKTVTRAQMAQILRNFCEAYDI